MDTGEDEWETGNKEEAKNGDERGERGPGGGVKFLDVRELELLGRVCPRLKRVEMSILKAKKAGGVVFVRNIDVGSEGSGWKRE